MKRLNQLGRLRPAFFLILFVAASILAQQPKRRRISLEWADKTLYDATIDKDARFLVGHVKFMDQGAFMYCDSAVLRENNNNFDAYGSVHIVRGDTFHVYGNTLFYDGFTKIAQLRGNIKLINKTTVLTTDKLDYDLGNDIGYYYENGKIVDSTTTLTSLIGRYYAKTEDVHFRKNVVATNPEYVMTTDTLNYNTVSDIAIILGPTKIVGDSAYGYSEKGWYNMKTKDLNLDKNSILIKKNQKMKGDNIFFNRLKNIGKNSSFIELEDTAQKVIMSGKNGFYDDAAGFSFLTDSAVFKQYTPTDTLFLHADTLQSVIDTSGQRVLKAYHNVRFWRRDVQGKCDSLVYAMADSTIRMFNEPVLWSQYNQLTGTYIRIYNANGKIDHVEMEDKAMVISREDSLRFNQIKGALITGYMFNNTLNKIYVDGNAQSLYFPRDKQFIIGMNYVESSYLTIYFEGGKSIKRIVMTPQTTGKMQPPNLKANGDEKLDGFTWQHLIRPSSREDIFRKTK